MKKRKKGQLISLKWFMLIVCLIGSIYVAHSSLSYTNAPIKAAKKTELQPGQIELSKTAEPVAGMVNQWDITLRIEGRNQFPPPPTDIVLIIDTSGSMKYNDRMIKAKTAAEKFVNLVLHKDYENRIALITYSSEVTNYTFNESGWSKQFVDSKHKGLLIDKIKELEPVVNGGTFTQAGIKSATEVMAKAKGKKRNVVLISDGVPTYSYPPTEPYNQLIGMDKFNYKQDDYTYYESVKTIPKEKFNYNKTYGNGVRYRNGAFAPEYEQMPTNSKNRLMANHAHSAIAEATITKNEKMSNGEYVVTDFYTIGVDMDSTSQDDEVVRGNQTMKEIATSEDKSFSATADNLEDILSSIAGEIVGAIKSAFVVDPMGLGFEMEGDVNVSQGTNEIKEVIGRPTINWNVGTLKTPVSSDPDEDVMFAEIKYRINAVNDILKPNIIDSNGLAATNGKTTIVYKDYSDEIEQTEFVVPKVKPIIVSLQKKLHDEKGEEIDDRTELFDFNYGKDQYTANDRFSLYSNEVKKIVHPWKADQNYTVEEVLKANQEYETTIDINGLAATTGGKSSFKFAPNVDAYAHQQIIVTNKKIPEKKTVVLNIRQSVLKPNSELVIPSKGFYQSVINETQQKLNLISASTTKDSATEISQELFTKYEITLAKQQEQLKIKDLIPEYYTFFAYIATTTNLDLNITHLSSNTSALVKNNEAILDYQKDNEYWVTMFIIPNFGEDSNEELFISPRPYSWDYKVNKFGSSF
ncbi:VWA domain-containing protein [Enterococcus ureasiticus]|uniref:vWA domain-containing protein n=1 Tax=Enterococcus ureasiticus TaxID=903984 RepID=UPI001A8D89F5|nr:vWA domain-containing protein [Enterococcus ureasiticus]MBO0474280.1 VWA domain-containing protein [Enterococcus ureasiticus]